VRNESLLLNNLYLLLKEILNIYYDFWYLRLLVYKKNFKIVQS